VKLSTVTGNGRDHLELTPETVAETAAVVFAGTSKFLADGATDLVVTPERAPFISLRVYVAPPAPAKPLDVATRDALDRTP
jgi:hypothetical protein